jgi:hypothetical protein
MAHRRLEGLERVSVSAAGPAPRMPLACFLGRPPALEGTVAEVGATPGEGP